MAEWARKAARKLEKKGREPLGVMAVGEGMVVGRV